MTKTQFRPSTCAASTGAMLLTVERGMQVLRAFQCERAAVSNAELVRRTGLSKATVSRLTTTFVQLGFLRHVAGGREFELGTGPLSIGHSFIEASPLVRTANPFLQALANKLNVSVALAVPNGLEMLYICYRTSDRIATLRLGVGSLLPLGTTSIGRAWLWALAPAEQKRRIAELRRAAGSRGAALEQGIRESFVELETTGICAVLGGYQRDAYGVATPVRIGRHGTPMGLSCGNAEVAPNLAQARKRIGPELKRAAEKLEALLAETDDLP